MNGNSGELDPSTRRVFLSLGSNIGDRRGVLREAVGSMAELVSISPLYETAPVGGPTQDPYFNVVVEIETRRPPLDVLGLCQELEHVAGRQRRVRWGPRTLDVDVLLIEAVEADESADDVAGWSKFDQPDLTVPHPRMHERNFVLKPLFDLAPELCSHPWFSDSPASKTLGEVRLLGAL